MFPGFESFDILGGDDVLIHGVVGGQGPPLLLLHGNPQTHVMWHRVAAGLAKHFTVVASDLRGYGDSSKPRGTPDHATYSKRVMAEDQVAVMSELGYPRFFVAGHDRGARVAHRMALDHPDCVAKVALYGSGSKKKRKTGVNWPSWRTPQALLMPRPSPAKRSGAWI